MNPEQTFELITMIAEKTPKIKPFAENISIKVFLIEFFHFACNTRNVVV